MKFIITRASQYNYLGDTEWTEPCTGGEWHRVIIEDAHEYNLPIITIYDDYME